MVPSSAGWAGGWVGPKPDAPDDGIRRLKRNIMVSVHEADSATSAEPRTIQADVRSGSERD